MVRFCYCSGLLLTDFEQEFSDPRDADDARFNLDGRDFEGSRIIVEFAKGVGQTSKSLIIFFLRFALLNCTRLFKGCFSSF